ncbi:hypothetical protein A3B02_02420 [Candidatus Roizmanbacteria bacterium RIFCSPLOWO2_01_FULL_42_14]|uniref:Uncharacterized protein n=2 Tax=Candidatus Roizmaniibacteriota TaxID=1752723 RepID=A0A1F7JW92_9BACT|nr:MAG: hypothetical protein A3B02_02420 [Candidatus Roizmanbacteria bacterium RIFCSPLOWO2_01_FULL_42_14]OGK59888.1 MAG: hypothetical protein A3I56_03425 [Candidatus Roizmanbacteria bacterium RIFCSPLOWO2_02_FULL_43_10]
MRRYKFSDLLLYEKRAKDLYFKLGLGFSSSNRISKYFAYLSNIEKSRKLDKASFSQLIQKDKAKYYYSQFNVLEMCNIIDAIDGSIQDEKILKKKLVDLSKGTYLLSEESSNNTKARDTTFELSLFSFFQARGLNIKLGDPNPDLQLVSNNFTYNIECKRPHSLNSLEKHIKEAVKQLKKSPGSNVVPTIALSLEQVLLRGDLILDSRDEESAANFLNATLEDFLQSNLKMVQKICGDEPCLVLYYLSCLTGFKSDIPMANATFITGNIYNFGESLSSSIYKNLNTIIPQEIYSSV